MPFLISKFSLYTDECDHLPLSNYLPACLRKPYPHWQVTLGFPSISKKNISRMCLMLNCGGHESDSCRFRPPSLSPFSVTCKLRNSAPEDASHLIAICHALSPARNVFDLPSPLSSAHDSNPVHFAALILGSEWLDDTAVQQASIEFIHHLLSARTLLLAPVSART